MDFGRICIKNNIFIEIIIENLRKIEEKGDEVIGKINGTVPMGHDWWDSYLDVTFTLDDMDHRVELR